MENQIEPVLINGQRPMSSQQLFAALEEAGIETETQHHQPLRTVEEAKAVRPNVAYGHTKNLFVRNKKGKMWLLTLHEDREIDLKTAAQQVGTNRFSFCSAERLMHYLGVIPGAVSPFAMMNDITSEVTFYIDEVLLSHPEWHVHPLDNSMTTTISSEALLKFLADNGHPYQVLP